jgi:hypothetical protein
MNTDDALRLLREAREKLLMVDDRWAVIGWLEAEIKIAEAALSQTEGRQPDSEPESPQAEPVAPWWLKVIEDARHANDSTTYSGICNSPYQEAVRIAIDAIEDDLRASAPPAAAQGGQPGEGA